jgi:hypothetical protein
MLRSTAHQQEARIMDVQTPPTTGRSVPSSPVDDHTYNVLQALTSTLESIEAYQGYRHEDGSDLFDRLLSDQRSHASLLLDELRTCIADGTTPTSMR